MYYIYVYIYRCRCICIWLYSIITDDILYITYVCYYHGQTKHQHMRQKIKSFSLAFKYQCLQNKTKSAHWLGEGILGCCSDQQPMGRFSGRTLPYLPKCFDEGDWHFDSYGQASAKKPKIVNVFVKGSPCAKHWLNFMTKPMSQLGMMTFYHVLGQRSETTGTTRSRSYMTSLRPCWWWALVLLA